MEEIMNIAIEDITSKWIIEHQNMIVKYAGRDVEFMDYILMLTTHSYVSRLENDFKTFIEAKRKENFVYLEEDAIEELGYSIENIKSKGFKELIYKVLKSKKTEFIESIKTNGYNSIKPFSMAVRNNKTISFNASDLERGIQTVIPKIRKFDPFFIKNIKNRITELEEKPREGIRDRFPRETDEEYERYLSEFYNGGSSKK